HPAEALQDVELELRLADSLKSDGLLTSQLVRIGMMEVAFQSVWEGLARQRWNENQVAELQSALARVNILEDYGRTVRTERAFAIHFIELLRTGKYRVRSQSDETNDNGAADYSRTRFLPGVIFLQNQLAIARLCQDNLIPLVDLTK